MNSRARNHNLPSRAAETASPTWRIGDGVSGICWGYRGG
jgi:hypothetical protein